MNRKEAIVSVFVGLTVGLAFWFVPVNSYFFNLPLIIIDWTHAAVFGCESMRRPDGTVQVIYACSALIANLGRAYILVMYYLGWALMGLGLGYAISGVKWTRGRTKTVVAIGLTAFMFITGLIIGKSLVQPSTSKENNHLVEVLPKEIVVASPSKPTTKLIVRSDSRDSTLYRAYIATSSDEKYVMSVLGPRQIVWSPKAKRVTLVSHISNEETVHIIDASDASYVVAGGQSEFIASQDNPKWYTHVYSGVVSWLTDDYSIISVSGYPDFGSFRPKSQFFLIDAKSGKVVKRVL